MGIMIMLLLLMSVTMCITVVFLRAKIYSPIFIHNFIWLFTISIGVLAYDRFIDIPELSVWAMLLWFTTVYCILFLMRLKSGHSSLYLDGKRQFENFKPIKRPQIWLFVIIVSVISIREVYEVGMGGPNNNFLLNLRLALIIKDYDGPRPFFILLFYPILTALFSICTFYEGSASKNTISLLVWQIVFAIGIAGKFAIMTPFVIMVVIGLFKQTIGVKKVIFSSLFIIFIMMLLHFSRMSEQDSMSIADILGIYIYSPLVALGLLENTIHTIHFGEYTFRIFYAVSYYFGFSELPPQETILDYVNVPFPTNVYTVMQPFYSDFGLLGVFLGAIFYGVFWGVLFKFVERKGYHYLMIYSLLVISLVTSFFGETLITNFSGNMKMVLSILFCLWGYRVWVRRLNQV